MPIACNRVTRDSLQEQLEKSQEYTNLTMAYRDREGLKYVTSKALGRSDIANRGNMIEAKLAIACHYSPMYLVQQDILDKHTRNITHLSGHLFSRATDLCGGNHARAFQIYEEAMRNALKSDLKHN